MIFDKLLATTLLCASMGLSNVDIREPNKANQVDSFLLNNATDFELTFENGYTSESYTLPSNTHMNVSTTFNNSDDWAVIYDGDWDNDLPTFWYSTLDGVNLVKYPNWEYGTGDSYFKVEGMTSVCSGIGVFKEMYLPTNVDYYIDLSLKGGISKGLSDWTGTIDILPEGTTCRLFRNDGTYATLTNIKFRRSNVQSSSNYDCVVYSQIGTNQYLMIANNKGVNVEYFQGFATPNELATLQPYVKYYNNFTNRIRFSSGSYPKEPANPNYKGYTPLENYGLTENVTGYIGYTTGGTEETMVALADGMALVASSFAVVSQFFGYMIFPGLSLGLLLCIPLLMQLIFVVIKLIKKG